MFQGGSCCIRIWAKVSKQSAYLKTLFILQRTSPIKWCSTCISGILNDHVSASNTYQFGYMSHANKPTYLRWDAPEVAMVEALMDFSSFPKYWSYLVGGWTHPFKTYASNLDHLPRNRGANRTSLKPPPRIFWNSSRHIHLEKCGKNFYGVNKATRRDQNAHLQQLHMLAV